MSTLRTFDAFAMVLLPGSPIVMVAALMPPIASTG
jgi:hypothetical protein